MNTEKTYDINLTASELEMIYFALNSYALAYMRKSVTYGNPEAYIANHGEDYAHSRANEVGKLQIKVGDIMNETR